MKLRKLKSPFWSLFAVALLLGLPFLCSGAQAPRGGGAGYHGGGGFSGGSFRGGGASVTQAPRGGAVAVGPRGGAVAQGPRGGAVAEGPRGGTAVRGPYGGAVAKGPGGQTAYRPGSYPGGAYHGGGYAGGAYYGGAAPDWDAYYGPDYGGGGIAAFIAGLAIGTVLAALPAGAVAQVLGGQTYYYDGSNYYQACYQGTDVDYCVVPNPNQ